ncbi:hypothetical protein N431DRAFT_384803 [Stipitochalara longipes BDJ]|nr:hypothetical protein N431DRAFT_384803 [Stipitochalara longipes BDJ]
MSPSPDHAEAEEDTVVQPITFRPEPSGPDLALEPGLFDELSFRLLGAVRTRDEDAVRHLLDDGANLSARNFEGQTPLHLAVRNGDTSMVHILLQKGADLEATAANGNKPLYDAAESGYIEIVELLLDFNANVEAFNIDKQRTALHQAVENGHFQVAKTLLRDGADIDARSPLGLTPLFCAVRRGDVELVGYLLEHGANKKIILDDGQTVEDFAKGNTAMINLLQSSQVLKGPSITNPDSATIEPRFTPRPSLPADQVNKQDACHGFEATITDFFLGDREERIQVSASIYDVLYGKGAEAIMDSEKGSMMGEQQLQFRWYHLPANNIEWVEALISRIFAEQNVGSVSLDDELKSKLGLTSTAGRQYRTLTAQSSFMRPMCQYFPTSKADQLVLFMPYLHFETLRGYQEMAHHISVTRAPPGPPHDQNFEFVRKKKKRPKETPPAPLAFVRPKRKPDSDDAPSTKSDETDNIKAAGWKQIFKRTGRLRSTLQDLKGKASSRSTILTEFLGISSTDEKDAKKDDLEKGKEGDIIPPLERLLTPSSEKQNVGKSESRKIDLVTAEREENLQLSRIDTKEENESAIKDSTKDHRIDDSVPLATAPVIGSGTQVVTTTHLEPQNKEEQVGSSPSAAGVRLSPMTALEDAKSEQNLATAETSQQSKQSNQNFLSSPRSDTFKGKHKLADIPEEGPTTIEDVGDMTVPAPRQPRRSDPQRAPTARVPLGQVDEVLIKAYSLPNELGQLAPLQLRRTLDQYFYTHLASTYERDTDQVVLRYTQNGLGIEPKIFMVDQLWLWVLNGDTVISCFPQRWDTWSTEIRMQPPPPPPPGATVPDGYTRRPLPFDLLVNPSGAQGRRPPPPPSPLSNWSWPSKARGGRPSNSGYPPPPPSSQQTMPHEHFFQPSELVNDVKDNTGPQLPSADGRGGTNVIINLEEVKNKSKATVKADPSGVLAWMAGKKRKGRKDSVDANIPVREPRDSRPTSSIEREEKKRRRAFLQLDPLNVHQTILKHLQGTTRAPITSAYELAKLITNSCTDVFDQYRIPPEYQFFDFFERSIGNLIDQETRCFKLFMKSLDNSFQGELTPFSRPTVNAVLSIAAETKLLVEIKDIRDELNILELVLKDELKALEEFEQAISGKAKGPPLTQNKVLLSHLERIQKMNDLAANTYQALNDLLDLKQKEFNVSEARKQAEITARHVEIADQSQKQGQRQVTLAEATMAQAEETARQGKTVMLFTVVTIIFLPLSFMAAFFAISVDSFPFNDNGKLPMSYVLKYMLSISAAISIPFVLIAFNQDRIAKWLKALGSGVIWWICIIVLMAVLLSLIWTSHLASGIKVAVTATIVLLAILALLGQVIHALVTAARWKGSSTGSETSGSLVDD